MELADRLGISYQAVSNWERGDSMPDIAKLSDLSEIFSISIDELLGNERQARIINQIRKQELIDFRELTIEELEDVLPIVKPKQIEKSVNEGKEIDFEQIQVLAPFLEEGDVDYLVTEKFCDMSLNKLIGLAPFMSEEVISKLFVDASNGEIDSNWFTSLAPFVSETAIEEVAFRIFKHQGIEKIVTLLPFMSENKLSELFTEGLNCADQFKKFVCVAPFVDQSIIDEAVQKWYHKNGLSEITGFLPFMTEKAIYNIYMKEIQKGTVMDTAILMPFIGKIIFEKHIK